jgi:uncharacterized protein YhaN
LDFSAGAPGGLHVIYGRNEAGKSTALRAVSGLLFGIPERTQDAHLHSAHQIRISGALEAADGRVLRIIRRKKRKDSLRDESDAPLDEAELGRMLAGVNRQLFHNLFALDHQALKMGGEALLAGKGDVGESLYDAGIGGQGIRSVLLGLEREAEQLFKPRGHNPKLNVALDAYKEAQRHSREAVLVPAVFFDQKNRLEEKRAERLRLEAERKLLLAERDRKRRIVNAFKPAARLGELQQHRARLGPMRPLPEASSERRQNASRVVLECNREIERMERSISRQLQRTAELPVDGALLAIEPAVLDGVNSQIAVVRQADWELPALHAAIAACEDEARAILERLGIGASVESARAMRPTLADEQRVRELERERALVIERLEAARRQVVKAQQALRHKELEWARLPPPSESFELEHLVHRAGMCGDLEGQIRALDVEHASAAIDAERALFALGFEAVDEERLLRLDLPSSESLDRFESAFSELEHELRQAGEEREERHAEVRELDRAIEGLQCEGELPTPEVLRAAREHRSRGWELVRRRLRGESLGDELRQYDPDRSLADAFEHALDSADAIADALCREAGRISELGRARVARQRAAVAAREADERTERAEARLAPLEQEWRTVWCNARPGVRAPAEVRAWLRRYGEWRALVEQRARFSRELEQRRAELAELERELRRILATAHGVSFGALVAEATSRLAQEAELAQERRLLAVARSELETRLSDAEAELSERQGELATWQKAWQAAIVRLELCSASSPGQVLAVLDELSELFRKLDELPEKQRRVSKLEGGQRAFSEQVKGLLERFAPELAGQPLERAAAELVRAAKQAQNNARERDALAAELAEQKRELEALFERKSSAEAELEQLLAASDANDLQELAELEQRAALAGELDAEIARIEHQLRDLGEGMPLDTLLSEIAGVDRATVVRDIEDIEARIEESEQLLHDAIGDIKQLELGLDRYRGGEEAAEAAQQLESLASEIRALVERYTRVRAASAILAREIARYRDQNQGPVLSMAAAIFPRLTLGRYTGLRVGLQDPVILCVRCDGAEVEVSGLSEGAQYQLYLALRLATLQRYLASSSPMPLILDDVLLHFDDERAKAAFEVFGELAQRIQILFFTHHSHHVELARAALGNGSLFVHDLGAPTRLQSEEHHARE